MVQFKEKEMNNARKLRNLYRMTQKDIAVKIDYPRPLYQAFENGKYDMPEDKLQLLAKLYNVSIDYILNKK